ncbi:DUF3489 domain-containing protein [Neogemmobacter tilapiae]|uniref:DUF3489 domain-containing protein n=1 Tax=Neogemmobacter tilapiae TaxID=875041 RepID=A0A918WMU8_9RHOB|nr:DUF3489 domain-containing protein [Gemmobacter tilapiae]GHC60618.1 hypothetical protein GCM10007315_25610 [Gemmobacter tilapiae]
MTVPATNDHLDGAVHSADIPPVGNTVEDPAEDLVEDNSANMDAPSAAQASLIAIAPRQTKAALLREKVLAPGGASLADLMRLTGWQAHTIRAALSGLRKSGLVLTRRREGTDSIYGVESAALDSSAVEIAAAGTGERAAANIAEPAETGATDPTISTPAATAQLPTDPAAASLDPAPVRT